MKKPSAIQKSAQNKQILIKISTKTSNLQVFKKTRKSTKKQAQTRGKPQGWQHWSVCRGKLRNFRADCSTV